MCIPLTSPTSPHTKSRRMFPRDFWRKSNTIITITIVAIVIIEVFTYFSHPTEKKNDNLWSNFRPSDETASQRVEQGQDYDATVRWHAKSEDHYEIMGAEICIRGVPSWARDPFDFGSNTSVAQINNGQKSNSPPTSGIWLMCLDCSFTREGGFQTVVDLLHRHIWFGDRWSRTLSTRVQSCALRCAERTINITFHFIKVAASQAVLTVNRGHIDGKIQIY